jgi:hypothetical protein
MNPPAMMIRSLRTRRVHSGDYVVALERATRGLSEIRVGIL